VPAAEHVQRQVAVAVVIAVEEAALLVSMRLSGLGACPGNGPGR
jgi:hypothetical protein